MPNLEEFTAGSGKIDVSDRGAETFAQAGRRAGIAYRELGEDIDRTVRPMGEQAIQHQTDMDVSNVYASLSQAKSGAMDNWTKATAQPGAIDHPDLGPSFLQQYGQGLDDIASHATTQQGKMIAMRLAAQYKEDMHGRVAADMSDLAAARWVGNRDTFLENTATSVVDDPSPENLAKELGAYQEFAENTIPSNVQPARRAELLAQSTEPDLQRITMSAYKSALFKGEDAAAAGQGDAAFGVIEKMAASETAFEHLPADFKAELPHMIEQAKFEGESRFRQRQNDQIEGMKREGAAAYAQIDTALSNYGTPDQQYSLEQLMALRSQYATKYGASNPGEVHALNDGIDRLRQLQADHKLDTGDGGKTFSALQGRLSIAPGQEGYISDQELANDWKNNSLSTEEFRMAREFRDKAASDPATKLGLEQLKAWQTHMLSGLVAPGQVAPGRGAASAAFVHDSTFTYNAIVKTGKTPAEAIEMLTNGQGPMGKAWVHNFQLYQRAAMRTDPAGYLKTANAPYYIAQGIAEGSVASPVTPTVGHQAAPKLSQDQVDAMFK